MNDINWFYDPDFQGLCKANRIEPSIALEGKLLLWYTTEPDTSVKDRIRKLVPKEWACKFEGGLSVARISKIRSYVRFYGVQQVFIITMPKGGIIIQINEVPDATATKKESSIWDVVADDIKGDPYVKYWAVMVAGEVFRCSDNFSEAVIPAGLKRQEPMADATVVHVQPVELPEEDLNDGRFDYERDFLPKDVGTDVKIMLESCNTVEDFLKNI